MTPLQIEVLRRAADMSHEPGTSVQFELESGRMQQVRWLLGQSYIRFLDNKHARVIATYRGKQMLETLRERGLRRERLAKLSREYQNGKGA